MKVGTDGVLLGAWCNAANASSALDIGTGCGLIAIMLAQRNPGCTIDSVEIDRESFLQAAENAARCPWSERIRVHHCSFQEFCQESGRQFDLIVSNPPYFRTSDKAHYRLVEMVVGNSSGELRSSGFQNSVWDAYFPFLGNVRFSCVDPVTSLRVDYDLFFELAKTGNWEVIIHY